MLALIRKFVLSDFLVCEKGKLMLSLISIHSAVVRMRLLTAGIL